MSAVPITTRRAAWLSVLWLVAGLALGLVVLGSLGDERAVNYWSVYVLERSLSLDNVFVFLLVLDYFLIPREYRRRVVRWGIICALALRALAIAVGSVLLESFSVVRYVLGAVLLLLAARMLRGRDEPIDPGRGGAFRVLRRLVPLTGDSSSGRLVARIGRGWAVTPLGLAVVALVLADLTFAVDSISGAFGITSDFVVIWLANALALLGLVPLLVLARALVQRFRYLSQTFAVLLLFIALRLLTGDVVSLSPLVSLTAIAAILLAGLLASAIGDLVAPPHVTERAARRPPRCPPGHVAPLEAVATRSGEPEGKQSS
jgi:TerC family integral membrane protein